MRAKFVANAVSRTVYVVLAEAAAVAAAQQIPMDVFYRLMARESGLMRPLKHRVSSPARKMAGALAAGCSLILKASEETPAGRLCRIAACRRVPHPARPDMTPVNSGGSSLMRSATRLPAPTM